MATHWHRVQFWQNKPLHGQLKAHKSLHTMALTPHKLNRLCQHQHIRVGQMGQDTDGWAFECLFNDFINIGINALTFTQKSPQNLTQALPKTELSPNPPLFLRRLPDDEQETSYLAASAKMDSLCCKRS